MKSFALLAVLALAASGVNATPITFADVEYQTTAVALIGSAADNQADSNPPTDLPLLTTATVFDADDFASASGIADDMLLGTQADADSPAAFASAVGTTEFIGTFTTTRGALQLNLGLDFLDATDSVAFSMGSLLAQVLHAGTPVATQLFTDPGNAIATFFLPGPGTYTLDLLLTSEADVTAGGSASNASQATFAAQAVSEPRTLMLVLTGLLLLAVPLRRRC
jgi:hypothetical protein